MIEIIIATAVATNQPQSTTEPKRTTPPQIQPTQTKNQTAPEKSGEGNNKLKQRILDKIRRKSNGK